CAALFTRNRVKAAPLLVSEPRVKKGFCQAVLVNSGNANACTGEAGLEDARRCARLAAQALKIDEELVTVSSTGAIGHALPMEKFERHVPQLASLLSADGADGFAKAICTTDAFVKVAQAKGDGYTILGIAKGAGMIHPNMATMLAYVMTDANVERGFLDRALHHAADYSFNRISVDGDTSTNDTLQVLANGASGLPEITEGSPLAAAFQERLTQVCLDLAKLMVKDGEGGTKLVRVQVEGGATETEALNVARHIATSTLLKAAFFGADPNWGRVMAAAGSSGEEVDPDRIDVRFEDVTLVRNGQNTGEEARERARAVLARPEFTVTVDLHRGSSSAYYYMSDLTYDYVKINAEYHT
ncbi:MAG: bifunctional glutamate N-acetyltransferase/amino-acid acetyltransferase ArgJ, partial [Deltaproteobacteria bacterium]|nr:bifunctional glutamate N-acetyltransferase/amino-acid acetyltransferase ArgJ [Deltaproteobacteria bacterium]